MSRPSPEDGSVGCLFRDAIMYLHLEEFSDRYKILMQLKMLSISACRETQSLEHLMGFHKSMSSAYIVPSEKPRSATQFMYVRKSKGPRTDPCGTPDGTDVVLDDAPSTTTYCFLHHRYEEIH